MAKRSPSYPGIDLRVALERAAVLFEKEGKVAAPAEAILDDWGYNKGSGGGLVTLAALKKFGLLEDEGSRGSRRARLTQLAIRIIHEPDEAEKERLVREAALKPPIHAELWKRYGARLPSDATLKRDLVVDKNFTQRGIREFIPQFRATMKYAGLEGGDSMTVEGEDEPEKEPDSMSTATSVGTAQAQTHGGADVRAVPIPISGQQTWPVLQAPYPMSDAQWDQMVAAIQAMKPAWAAQAQDDPEPEDA